MQYFELKKCFEVFDFLLRQLHQNESLLIAGDFQVKIYIKYMNE